ncbi:MAG: DUF3098 domain-containing protein [Flavobacterium sp.]|nr:DUF3098 domain-containing protein [Candidatus Neoflavobacterium equi]
MNKQTNNQLFGATNFKILLLGIAVIAIGYLLMSGGGTTDPNVFSDAIFNFRRIRLAPTVVLIGIGITIYSIFKKDANKTDDK